jgi:hypothetical protein
MYNTIKFFRFFIEISKNLGKKNALPPCFKNTTFSLNKTTRWRFEPPIFGVESLQIEVLVVPSELPQAPMPDKHRLPLLKDKL